MGKPPPTPYKDTNTWNKKTKNRPKPLHSRICPPSSVLGQLGVSQFTTTLNLPSIANFTNLKWTECNSKCPTNSVEVGYSTYHSQTCNSVECIDKYKTFSPVANYEGSTPEPGDYYCLSGGFSNKASTFVCGTADKKTTCPNIGNIESSSFYYNNKQNIQHPDCNYHCVYEILSIKNMESIINDNVVLKGDLKYLKSIMAQRYAFTSIAKIWSDQLFKQPKINNNFRSMGNYFDPSEKNNYKSTLLQNTDVYLSTTFSNFIGTNFTKLQQLMTDGLKFPYFSMDKNEIYINIPIYSHELNYSNLNFTGNQLSVFLQNFLGDPLNKEAWINTPINPHKGTIYDDPYFTFIFKNELFNIETNINAKNPGRKLFNGFNYVLSRIYSCTIKTWSPTLFLLFQNQFPLFMNEQFCKTLSLIGITPNYCYSSVCKSLNVNCVELVKTTCNPENDPIINFPIPHFIYDQNIVISTSRVCDCYNSGVTPAILSGDPPSRKAGTCFSNCSPATKKALGAVDCSQYCDIVKGWYLNNQMRMPEDFNKAYYTSICGQILPSKKVSWVVLISGLSFSVIMFIILFLATKNIKIAGFLFIFLLSLTIYLSFDLAGTPWCNNTTHKRQCKSNISKIEIPQVFCGYDYYCECDQSSDCKDNKLCESGQCIECKKKCGDGKTGLLCNIDDGCKGICKCPEGYSCQYNKCKKIEDLVYISSTQYLNVGAISGGNPPTIIKNCAFLKKGLYEGDILALNMMNCLNEYSSCCKNTNNPGYPINIDIKWNSTNRTFTFTNKGPNKFIKIGCFATFGTTDCLSGSTSLVPSIGIKTALTISGNGHATSDKIHLPPNL